MLSRLRSKYANIILPRVKEIFDHQEFEILLDNSELLALEHRQN